MPLDPSIISSYNPTSGIDLNALMTQRMQGMANINAMERQRQADALALEDRAAAQKKAQEDAAIDALIPAYVYGIDNPTDIEGMLALVPPNMQANVAPYVDKVRGLPPEQVKSLLTSSLLSSDRGKAFLENKARERTYQVQLQQAETAAAREKREAEAAGKPKRRTVSSTQVDAEGNVRFFDDEGNLIRIEPKAGKPAAPVAGAGTSEQKMQAREGVDGTLARIKEQYDILKKEKEIVSSEASTAENIGARIKTQLGPTVGRTIGTKAQTARDTIANLRQALLTDIKAATGMSSKAIDSNVELKSFLDSLGDPDQSIETIQNTLAELSIKYGMGTLGGKTAPTTTAAPQNTGAVPQITSDEEFDALPSGTEFIDPDGVRRRKP